MTTLIIGAHSDDETIGMGGTTAQYSARGDEIELCTVTNVHEPRWTKLDIEQKKDETRKAAKILGIKKVHFLDLPTARLETLARQDINDKILEVIQKIGPDTIFTNFPGDIHKDHRFVFEAVSIAARPKPNSFIKKVIVFQTNSSTEWGSQVLLKPFVPNMFVNISSTIDIKIKAFQEYKHEIKEWPHPRSIEGIITSAKYWGSSVGLEMAEPFFIVRMIS